MLFVSNCNGWKPGEPLKLRTVGSLFPPPRPWPLPCLLLLGMAVSCSFNDVWAWNFARGVSEVLPSPSARSQSQPGPTNWLAYQFIISFNKVDIQPRTKREKPSGSACWFFFVRLRLAEWIMIARASPRRSAPRCWTCCAWHFGTFLFPGTGSTRPCDRQPAGGRLAYAATL